MRLHLQADHGTVITTDRSLTNLFNMRIAVAGTGDFSKYFVEELLQASIEVVVLARGPRDWFTRPDISLRITNYTVSSLTQHLQDCDGLVSAIQDTTMSNVTSHLAMLEACTLSPRCKRFIPSEYIGNVDDFPDQPLFYYENHQPIREALRKQSAVEWTLFNLGWLADYTVPARFRYIRNIDAYHPIDFKTKIMTIPGTGDEPIGMTSARDGARAVARLFSLPELEWEQSTFVCGELTTWNRVAKLLAGEGYDFKVVYQPVEELEKIIKESSDEEAVVVAQFGIWSTSGSTEMPAAELAAHKKKYFQGIEIRNLRQLFDATKGSDKIGSKI